MKKVFVLLLAVLLLLIPIACSGKNGSEDQHGDSGNETEATAAPTGSPDIGGVYDGHDLGVLRAFFENTDEDGVRNGDKVFTDYDPDDPESWFSVQGNLPEVSGLSWDPVSGKLISLDLANRERSRAILAGTLELSGFDSLRSVSVTYIDLSALTVRDCPTLTGLLQTASVVQGDIDITLAGGAKVNVLTDRTLRLAVLPCDYEGTELDFTLYMDVIDAPYDCIGLDLHPDDGQGGCLTLIHEPSVGRYYTGWTDSEGEHCWDYPIFMPFMGMDAIRGEYRYSAHSMIAGPGSSFGVSVIPGESAVVTEEDIEEAIRIVEEEFAANWWGCTLVEIGYAGDDFTAAMKPYGLAANADKVIYLTSTFMTGPDCPDDSLGRNAVYPDWTWILIKTGDGPWTLVDWGY